MHACMADLACLAVGPDQKCGFSTISIKMLMVELNMIKQKGGVTECEKDRDGSNGLEIE